MKDAVITNAEKKKILNIVTVSLDRQKDILRNPSMNPTYLIYSRISNIISVTKNRLLNNIGHYRTKLSLLLNLSHH